MTRQDPGTANGTGVYPVDPPCVCGCSAPLHEFGRRGGQTVRTACSNSNCKCGRYAAADTAPHEAWFDFWHGLSHKEAK